ncbi:MAG: ATP-binding cassette domain-containing protein [Clostridia bacterium]|nr:ATP-binding cassette domain-containing protein [Clostridia bacterium]
MLIDDIYDTIDTEPLSTVIARYPAAEDFLRNYRMENISRQLRFDDALRDISPEIFEEFGIAAADCADFLAEFILEMSFSAEKTGRIKEISIVGGTDKSGKPENAQLTIRPGETIGIVGPTGSGKSRLLGDIECLAQGDTPTKRRIMLNGEYPDEDMRMEHSGLLVAQISQNMNFVMDLTVGEFLQMHAKSRGFNDTTEVTQKCFECANSLSGEKFSKDVKVTQLSGGQSRALMIADVACLSVSPIILIDEIENAGIDRTKAVRLLTAQEKIIFISTHDPLLALQADKRIVLKNGGIFKTLDTSEQERLMQREIEMLDNRLFSMRQALRSGERITENL